MVQEARPAGTICRGLGGATTKRHQLCQLVEEEEEAGRDLNGQAGPHCLRMDAPVVNGSICTPTAASDPRRTIGGDLGS